MKNLFLLPAGLEVKDLLVPAVVVICAIIVLIVGLALAGAVKKIAKKINTENTATPDTSALQQLLPQQPINNIINIASGDFANGEGFGKNGYKQIKNATVAEEEYKYIDYSELEEEKQPEAVEVKEEKPVVVEQASVQEEVKAEPVEEKVEETPAELPAQEEIPAELPAQEETLEVVEATATDETAATEDESDDSSEVAFVSEKKNLEDKYAELSDVQKGYFDKIKEYACSKEDARAIEAKGHITVKYGKERLVRITIRRDAVEAVFLLIDSNFKKYMKEQDAPIKEKPTVIRIENDAYLQLALETVDLKYNSLMEEKQQRLEEQKAKKRERARKQTAAVEEQATQEVAATDATEPAPEENA